MAGICINNKNMEKIKVLVSWSENNYSACTDDYSSLNGVIIATGKTFDKLKAEFQSAIKYHIDGCLSDGDVLPEWLKNGNYELDYELQTSALLHRLDGLVTRSAIARITGINEKQIGHYASGIRNPRPKQRQRIINGIHSISRELASVV
jgi:predicted RNase H-like HicB family nuclease